MMSTAASTGIGNSASGPVRKTSTEDHHRRGHEPGDLRLAADRVVDGRSRIGAADRKSFQQARADVRDAERDEFLIWIEIVAVLHGEAAAGHHRAVEADECEADGRENKLAELRRAKGGNHQRREPRWNRADERDAAATQVQRPGRQDAQSDADERRRDLSRESLDGE